MKRCKACGEEFEDKFSFCPVDATPLNSLAAAVAGELANESANTLPSRRGREDAATDVYRETSRVSLNND